MLIHAKLKRIEEHLSILQKEIKEITGIIEMLTTIYQTTEHPEEIRRQLQFMQREKRCVQEKKEILEKAVAEFSEMLRKTDDEMTDIADLLQHL